MSSWQSWTTSLITPKSVTITSSIIKIHTSINIHSQTKYFTRLIWRYYPACEQNASRDSTIQLDPKAFRRVDTLSRRQCLGNMKLLSRWIQWKMNAIKNIRLDSFSCLGISSSLSNCETDFCHLSRFRLNRRYRTLIIWFEFENTCTKLSEIRYLLVVIF